MLIIRENKLIAGILGGLVAVVALVLIFSGGSDSPTLPASDIPDGTPTAARTVAPEVESFPRPNIEQLACGPLLDFDDIDPVLDTTEWLTISGGETCTHRLLEDGDVFVRISAGHPNDLIAGGSLEGVPGQRVSGVGEAAVWFGDASTLSVGAQGRFGILIFRVTVNVPALDEADRLKAAQALAQSALPRFPGIEVEPAPPPDPVVVTIEHEPVDQSDQSYVSNLLAREVDGEWTRGEGLVATMQLLAGEQDAVEVLRHAAVLDSSGTGILRLAQAFLEDHADAPEAPEIERLLDSLIPRPELVAQASAEPAQRGFRSMAVQESEQYLEGCYSVWPDHGDPCFMWAEAHPAYGQKYLLWFPDEDEWEGWTRGPSTVRDAIRKTAAQLEGMDGNMQKVEVVLGPGQGHSSVLLEGTGTCTIVLNRGAQALRDQSPALLQQAVASAISRCYIDWNFGVAEAWESPAAWYLSDVIYPNASMETTVLNIPGLLGREELRSALTERSLTNMPFFEYVDSARGLEGAMAALVAIAGTGPAAISGIDDLLHEYAKSLTDGVIIDQGGAHSFGPGADRYDLSPGLTISAEPRAFGLERVQVTAPSGMYACMEYPNAGNPDLIVSWRQGAPGGGGSWSDSLPADLQGTAVFLITAGEDPGSFQIKVDDVGEEPGCEEEEEDSPSDPGEPCDLCDGTSFYYDLSFQEWLNIAAGRG